MHLQFKLLIFIGYGYIILAKSANDNKTVSESGHSKFNISVDNKTDSWEYVSVKNSVVW